MPRKSPKGRAQGAAGVLGRLMWPKPVKNGWLALVLLNLAVALAGGESAYVQAATTNQTLSRAIFATPSFLFLLSLDLLVPLTIALLSRRIFIVYLAGHCLLNIVLLHYKIFFYNPLTLSTIYHSMQGAASLGLDIFGFARWPLIAAMLALFFVKLLLVRLSWLPGKAMPGVWRLRGITAVSCLAVIWCISMVIYGKTGLSLLWVDSRGHRTATERRMETGTSEAVRNIGYVATWIGEWMSGSYADTALIYAEERCVDPDRYGIRERSSAQGAPAAWHGLPVPPLGRTVVLVQAESLDFAALSMKVNGHTVLPFIDYLAQDSLVLKVFAPHKVGSSNSDYEILNGRVAGQNVIYYSYIKEYPDSAIHLLKRKGYAAEAFHGLSGVLFNLRAAYEAQGFDRLFFKEELLAAGYAESAYIMEHVLDADVFDKAAKEMERGGKRVQFIITMSSHIPFLDVLPIFQRAGGAFARYVSSLRYFDQSLAACYARLPAGTLLIIWGDHGSDVDYPQSFAENGRHVPFLVHVKGNSAWLNGLPEDCPVDPGVGGALSGPGGAGNRNLNLEALLYPVGRTSGPRLASAKVYGLCELSYYIRRIVEQETKEEDW